jgi:putative FmdB family regulatory protein
MPVYDYVCGSCHHRFEVFRGLNEAGPHRCPLCEGPVTRAFAPPTIHFKGSGWAKKDRRTSGAPSKKVAADESKSGDSKSGERASGDSKGTERASGDSKGTESGGGERRSAESNAAAKSGESKGRERGPGESKSSESKSSESTSTSPGSGD